MGGHLRGAEDKAAVAQDVLDIEAAALERAPLLVCHALPVCWEPARRLVHHHERMHAHYTCDNEMVQYVLVCWISRYVWKEAR